MPLTIEHVKQIINLAQKASTIYPGNPDRSADFNEGIRSGGYTMTVAILKFIEDMEQE